ncbi:transposase [Xenorhabdus bovienii]|uniref:transposase n=1 Tax=Xenorhabdus bovienii TaxID=40576 RepID=UPI00068F9F49|nr:transposase [Xenorhabdus bovienii]
MTQFIEKMSSVPKKSQQFQNIILQDGNSFKVHSELADVFPYHFKATAAAVECHMTMSLLTQSPSAMTITADTASERAYLPTPETLCGQLLLADAGYLDFHYLEQLSLYGGSFVIRGTQSLNPLIMPARNGKGK